MERYQEIMVALSESVKKNRVERPLAHIELAIKPHYLANHASQIKRYYGIEVGRIIEMDTGIAIFEKNQNRLDI